MLECTFFLQTSYPQRNMCHISQLHLSLLTLEKFVDQVCFIKSYLKLGNNYNYEAGKKKKS